MHDGVLLAAGEEPVPGAGGGAGGPGAHHHPQHPTDAPQQLSSNWSALSGMLTSSYSSWSALSGMLTSCP